MNVRIADSVHSVVNLLYVTAEFVYYEIISNTYIPQNLRYFFDRSLVEAGKLSRVLRICSYLTQCIMGTGLERQPACTYYRGCDTFQ